MRAKVIYRDVVLWDEPGGVHHKAFLHLGDEVEVIGGWEYKDRQWEDKRFLKVRAKGRTGYLLASAITPYKEKTNASNNCNKEKSWDEKSWYSKAIAIDI